MKTRMLILLPPSVPAKPVVEIEAYGGFILCAPIMLNPDLFERGLCDHHDSESLKYIVNGCRYGVDIGYEGM